MRTQQIASIFKYVVRLARVSAIGASALKLRFAYSKFAADLPELGWLVATMFALVCGLLIFPPHTFPTQRRATARVTVIILKVLVALALGTQCYATQIQAEMAATAGVGVLVNPVALFAYALLPPWPSQFTPNVIVYAGCLLLLDVFETLLEGIDDDIDGGLGESDPV
jgi:hypothetical protein